MPRFGTTFVLLLMCIACGLLLWVLDRPAMRREQGGGGMTSPLFSSSLREVDYLVLERDGLRAELRLGADGWELTHPVAARASQAAVQRLLDACERAPLRARLTAHELALRDLSLADFGLLEPATRLIVSGPRARSELLLGYRTSASNEVFCAFIPSGDVLVTDLALQGALPASLEELGDKRLFYGDPRRVESLSLRRAGMPFVKITRGNGGWRLTQPIEARADGAAVDALLETLAATRIARFVLPAAEGAGSGVPARGERLRRFGLDDDDPEGVLVQVWMAGDPVGRRFRLGSAVVGMPGHIHALADEGVAVVAVTNSLMAAARQPLDAWRDKRLYTAAADDVRALAVQGAGMPLSLKRDAGAAWELTTPVAELAEPAMVTHLIDALLGLAACGFERREVDAAAGGGTGAVVRIDLETRQGASRLVGVAASAPETSARLAFTNDSTVYLVPGPAWSNVVQLLSDPAELRNRTLLRLPAADIRRITVRRADGATEEVVRDGNAGAGEWRAGERGRLVNVGALDAWLAALADLRSERVASLRAETGLEHYGLSKPHIEITVDLTVEDALRRVLEIGAMAPGGGRFAAVKGHDTVFVLDAATWRRLEQPLLQPAGAAAPDAGAAPAPPLEKP